MIAKCGGCHAADERGIMERISFTRGTPEGWQEVLKRMIVVNGARLNPDEARSVVKYLSSAHGLGPEEARPVMYEMERRIHDETGLAPDNVLNACAKCHSLARSLAWRRTPEAWKQFAAGHAQRVRFPPDEDAISYLAKAAPLHTPEWDAWQSRRQPPSLAGRWLVTATLAGKGKFYGDMQLAAAGDDEFTTTVRLTSVNDGSTLSRTGRTAVYGGLAWRGRSKGAAASASAGLDLSSEMREVMVVSPDQTTAEGRWFWGQYQEFGFDVQLRRPSAGFTLLTASPSALKTGSLANMVRLIGDNFPLQLQLKPSDLSLGSGLTVRRIVSRNEKEVTAEIDVAADASIGKRGAFAIYDRIDYIKVIPESAMAAFGDQSHPRGYQQFAASAFHRGADGKAHTADDLDLGPVDVVWSLEVFYAAEGASSDHVGKVNADGFFTPSAENPNANFDVWVVATAKSENGGNGRPLVGKSYMVVTVPTYTFNGRRYVRDLDRWVDDGPAEVR